MNGSEIRKNGSRRLININDHAESISLYMRMHELTLSFFFFSILSFFLLLFHNSVSSLEFVDQINFVLLEFGWNASCPFPSNIECRSCAKNLARIARLRLWGYVEQILRRWIEYCRTEWRILCHSTSFGSARWYFWRKKLWSIEIGIQSIASSTRYRIFYCAKSSIRRQPFRYIFNSKKNSWLHHFYWALLHAGRADSKHTCIGGFHPGNRSARDRHRKSHRAPDCYCGICYT